MKLLATDYDGTLNYIHTVLKEDKKAIDQWKKEGNLFVIDTGRSMESILGEVIKYDLPVDFFITNNGGMVFDKDKNVLFSSYLDNETSHEVLKLTKNIPGVVSYVVNDGIYRHRIVINENLVEKRYPELKPDLSEDEVIKMGNYAQIVISMDNPQTALDLAQQINELYSDTIVAYANKFVVDVVPKGISKAFGLEFVMKHFGLDIEDVYAIGDADNDIPLMTFNKNGACMMKSEKNVKKMQHIYIAL